MIFFFHCYVSLPEGNDTVDDIVDFPIKNSDFFFHCYVSLPEGNDTVDDIVDFPIKNSDFFPLLC